MTYDSLSRVIQVQRYVYSGGTYVEDTMERTNYSYDTNPYNGTYSHYTAGRLAAVQYYGGHCNSYVPSGSRSGCDLIQEWYNYNMQGAMIGKKVVLARSPVSGSLSASFTVDNEGRPASVTYPSWKSCSTCSTIAGSSYTFAYDTMGRINTMTDTVNTHTLVSGMTYGVANEVQQMTSGYTAGVSTESRTYNGMFQLTELTVGSALHNSYAYSATQNNGKITSENDLLSGEQVLYTYDSLNRLASAQTAGTGGWGQSYTYDGFGNLTDQTLIKGTAPDVHVAYNYLTNRQTGDTADANGNIGSTNVYDIDNRLVQPSSGAAGLYAYDPSNKRVWRWNASGLDELTFWAGQKLATYQISVDGGGVWFTLTSTNVSFGGKLVSKGTYNSSGTGDKVSLTPVVADRLGSIGKFYPYGVERPSATQNDKEKFTGYFRDASTGLDYADQRYEQPGMGRFMTPDPYGGSAKASDPGSWNRYSYVGGDPINRVDPTGQYSESDFNIYSGSTGGGWAAASWANPSMYGSYGLGFQWLDLGFAYSETSAWYSNIVFFWSPFFQGGGGGGSPCDGMDPTIRSFLSSHKAAADALSQVSGVPANYILAWAGIESGNGLGATAVFNGNYFGLTVPPGGTTAGWIGAIGCDLQDAPGHACFGSSDNFYASGYAALFSNNSRNLNRILAEAQAGHGGVSDVFNAIASGAPNMQFNTNPAYGQAIENYYYTSIVPYIGCF